jgi:hypothetical protein
MVINTANVAAFGQLLHLHFALIFLPLYLSLRHCFLVVTLALYIEPDNCERRTACLLAFPGLSLFSPGLNMSPLQRPQSCRADQ